MNNKKFLFTGLIIIGLALGFYGWLGGFNTPEITQITTTEMLVAGKEFRGSVKSEELGKLFLEAGKLVKEKKIAGDLGNIMYNNPEKQNDSIRAFIGVIVPSKEVKLPAGYQIRNVPAGQKALRSQINAHYMLAPGKIYEAVFEYAKQNKLQIQDFYVERFPDSHHADFLVFLK